MKPCKDCPYRPENKRYLLRSKSCLNHSIEYLTELTEAQLNSPKWQSEIERLKSNEYTDSFVSLTRI